MICDGPRCVDRVEPGTHGYWTVTEYAAGAVIARGDFCSAACQSDWIAARDKTRGV